MSLVFLLPGVFFLPPCSSFFYFFTRFSVSSYCFASPLDSHRDVCCIVQRFFFPGLLHLLSCKLVHLTFFFTLLASALFFLRDNFGDWFKILAHVPPPSLKYSIIAEGVPQLWPHFVLHPSFFYPWSPKQAILSSLFMTLQIFHGIVSLADVMSKLSCQICPGRSLLFHPNFLLDCPLFFFQCRLSILDGSLSTSQYKRNSFLSLRCLTPSHSYL